MQLPCPQGIDGMITILYIVLHTPSPPVAHHTHSETRVRYWNAYMLFYEAVDKGRSGEITPSKSSELPSPLLPPTGDEGLKQLQVYITVHQYLLKHHRGFG